MKTEAIYTCETGGRGRMLGMEWKLMGSFIAGGEFREREGGGVGERASFN